MELCFVFLWALTCQWGYVPSSTRRLSPQRVDDLLTLPGCLLLLSRCSDYAPSHCSDHARSDCRSWQRQQGSGTGDFQQDGLAYEGKRERSFSRCWVLALWAGQQVDVTLFCLKICFLTQPCVMFERHYCESLSLFSNDFLFVSTWCERPSLTSKSFQNNQAAW